MIGIVLSDRFIICISWDKETGVLSNSDLVKIPFNQSISDILTNESELNLVLTSILKKLNQINPFHGKNIVIAIPDQFVFHSVVENEFELSNDEKFDYIKWVENSKTKPNNHLISTFAQTYLPNESNFHVCSVSKILIRTLKLSIIEMGGNPTWMGPASTLYLDGLGLQDLSIIYRSGNKYYFLKKFNNRFDLGEISFSGGLPKIIYSTDPKPELILSSFGLEKTDVKKIPIYCPQKLGRNALSAWGNADLYHGILFENLNLENENIDGIPHLEANILSRLVNNISIKLSFNFFEDIGITEYVFEPEILEPIIDVDIEKVKVVPKEPKKEEKSKKLAKISSSEINAENQTNSKNLIFALLLIIGSFVFFNYIKFRTELNNSSFGLNKGFFVERIKKDYDGKIIEKNSIKDSKELLMQSKSISSAILSLFTETELNRYNALTITKSFLSLEYLSGTNPNIENILGVTPTSFSVEAVGKDSTIFLWYYSFDLPLLSSEHISGDYSKIELIKKLHTDLSESPTIKYFEKVYTKYQIYGPMLIWIKNKADILQASAIISNMDDSILLRKFVLFNEADRPNPRAGFYVSILED